MKHAAKLGLAWLGAMLTASAAGPDEPLFSNSSFALDHSNRGWPDGWGSPGTGKTWENENGRSFLRLTAPGPDQMEMLYRAVKFTPGKISALDFVMLYRLSDSGGEDAPTAILVFKDRSGSLCGHEMLPLAGESGKWLEARKTILLPKDTAQIAVLTGWPEGGKGTLDLASLSALPVVPAEKLAEPPPRERVALPVNGDFATATASDHWPEGWGKPSPDMSWNRAEGFIRLVSQKAGETLMLDRKLPLAPGTCGVEVAIRSRTSGVQHGEHEWFDARTIIHFLGADGQILPGERSLDIVFTHKPEPTDWIERTQFLRVPPGATTLELRPGLFLAKAGTVDLARVAVYAVNQDDSRLLQLAASAASVSKGEEDAEADRNFELRLQAQLRASGNLVANGTFQSQTTGATWPDDWGKTPPAGLRWVKGEGHPFVHFESHDETKIVMLYKMVPLTSGAKEVDVTFRYRTTKIAKAAASSGDARVAMHFLNGTRIGHLENGKNMEPEPEPILFSADASDWTEITRRLAVPEGATKLQLMPGLWKTSAFTLDLAEIRIAPADPAALKSPTSKNPNEHPNHP